MEELIGRDERRRPKPCRGCIYAGWTPSYDPCCDYILMTGHMRPCPPGEGCTERRLAKQAVNWEAARAVYDSGALDRQIAKAAGCSIAAVRLWREREGLESNYRKRDGRRIGAPGPERGRAQGRRAARRPVRDGGKASRPCAQPERDNLEQLKQKREAK